MYTEILFCAERRDIIIFYNIVSNMPFSRRDLSFGCGTRVYYIRKSVCAPNFFFFGILMFTLYCMSVLVRQLARMSLAFSFMPTPKKNWTDCCRFFFPSISIRIVSIFIPKNVWHITYNIKHCIIMNMSRVWHLCVYVCKNIFFSFLMGM